MPERCTLMLGGATANIEFFLRRTWWRCCSACNNVRGRTLMVAQPIVTYRDGEQRMMHAAELLMTDTLTRLYQSGELAVCPNPNCWQWLADSLKKSGLTWKPSIVIRSELLSQRRIKDIGIALPTRTPSRGRRKHIRELKAKRRHASTHGPRMAEARRWLTSHGYPLPVLPPHPGQAARLEARERTRIAASKAEQARREQLAYERRQAEIAERSARLRDLENEEREFATGRRGYTRRYYSPLY